MTRMLIPIAVAAVLCMSSGCRSSGDSAGAELTNTYWKLTEIIGGPPVAGAGSREAYIRLAPGENRLEGSTGCNSMFGTYKLDGAALSFSAIGSTKMACENVMQQESALLAGLGATTGWTITGRRLELRGADGNALLRFDVGEKK